MGKVSKRIKLVRKLDKVFGDFIKARDKYRSVMSGSSDRIQCGHVFTRSHYSTRWDEKNAFAQTAGENMSHEDNAWPFYKWYQTQFGLNAFETLYAKHHTTVKFKNADLEDLIKKYEKKLKEEEFGEVLW